MGQNWKTTVGGILLALGSALLLVPLPEEYKWIPAFLSTIGGGLLGVTAKDATTHSTTAQVHQATTEAAKEMKK